MYFAKASAITHRGCVFKACFVLFYLSAYVAIKLDRMWTGRRGIVMQAWT